MKTLFFFLLVSSALFAQTENFYQTAPAYPISEEEFSGLVNSIKNESFQENQLSVVQISARYN